MKHPAQDYRTSVTVRFKCRSIWIQSRCSSCCFKVKARSQYRGNQPKGGNTSEYLQYSQCSIKKDTHDSKGIPCVTVACLEHSFCGTQLLRVWWTLRSDRVVGGTIQCWLFNSTKFIQRQKHSSGRWNGKYSVQEMTAAAWRKKTEGLCIISCEFSNKPLGLKGHMG